jgi:5-keto-L-gluconate epimerase
MMKTSFMTSPFVGSSGVGLFGSIKVENGLGLFKGNLEKAFQVAQELDYDGLEIAIPNPDEVELPKLKKLVENYNINISSFGTGGAAVRDRLTFTSFNQSIRESAVERIRHFIDMASHFEAVVVISLVRGGIVENAEKSKARMTECLKLCSEYADKKGVFLAFEAVNRFQEDFFHSILDCKEYFEEVNLPNLGMLIDSFHMNMEDSDMWGNIKEASNYIIHVHYADSNRLAPGMGHFDFCQMTKTLHEIDYHGYVSAEILPYPDSFIAAKESIKKIKECLNHIK